MSDVCSHWGLGLEECGEDSSMFQADHDMQIIELRVDHETV